MVLTVQNNLDRDVTIRVTVVATNGVLGFRAPPGTVQTIPARNRKTISIATHVERLGTFRACQHRHAGRASPRQSDLLNLRSTAIGGITKTITIAAASILILALLRRLVRRIRRGPAPSAMANAPTASAAVT